MRWRASFSVKFVFLVLRFIYWYPIYHWSKLKMNNVYIWFLTRKTSRYSFFFLSCFFASCGLQLGCQSYFLQYINREMFLFVSHVICFLQNAGGLKNYCIFCVCCMSYVICIPTKRFLWRLISLRSLHGLQLKCHIHSACNFVHAFQSSVLILNT